MARTEIAAEASLDTTKFQRGLKKADTGVKKFAKSAARSFGTLLGATALAAGTKRLSDYVTQMENSARIAGEASEEFQKFAFATKTVGIEQEKAADILKDVKDKVGDFLATGAGPMADFFENIAPLVGVTADQFKRLSGREALQLYVSSLEKAGVSSNEMTFYLEAIASDASALYPLLQNNAKALDALGNKAEKLGAVIDKDAARAIKSMNDSLEQSGNVALATGAKLFNFGQSVFENMFAVVAAVGDANVEWWELTDNIDNATEATNNLNRAQKTQIQLQREVNALVAEAIGQNNERLPTIDELLKLEQEQIEYNRKKKKQEEDLAKLEKEKAEREEKEAARKREQAAKDKKDQQIAQQELKILKLRAIGEDTLANKLEKKVEIARRALAISRAHNISLRDALNLVKNIDARSAGGAESGGASGESVASGIQTGKIGAAGRIGSGPSAMFLAKEAQAGFFNGGTMAGRTRFGKDLEKAAARRPQSKDPLAIQSDMAKSLKTIEREMTQTSTG